jgi:hypothetical protein
VEEFNSLMINQLNDGEFEPALLAAVATYYNKNAHYLPLLIPPISMNLPPQILPSTVNSFNPDFNQPQVPYGCVPAVFPYSKMISENNIFPGNNHPLFPQRPPPFPIPLQSHFPPHLQYISPPNIPHYPLPFNSSILPFNSAYPVNNSLQDKTENFFKETLNNHNEITLESHQRSRSRSPSNTNRKVLYSLQ